jgi:hypothetical protein
MHEQRTKNQRQNGNFSIKKGNKSMEEIMVSLNLLLYDSTEAMEGRNVT